MYFFLINFNSTSALHVQDNVNEIKQILVIEKVPDQVLVIFSSETRKISLKIRLNSCFSTIVKPIVTQHNTSTTE